LTYAVAIARTTGVRLMLMPMTPEWVLFAVSEAGERKKWLENWDSNFLLSINDVDLFPARLLAFPLSAACKGRPDISQQIPAVAIDGYAAHWWFSNRPSRNPFLFLRQSATPDLILLRDPRSGPS
jgi:hypothetical protein